MDVGQARKIIEEIHERYGIQFSETQEKREDGKIRMIFVTLKFKIDQVGAYSNTPVHGTHNTPVKISIDKL